MKKEKLVRDKIALRILKGKEASKIRKAGAREYNILLAEKLVEEAREYQESGTVEELADVEEVIDAILDSKKLSREELSEIKNTKFSKKGGFYNRFVLALDDKEGE